MYKVQEILLTLLPGGQGLHSDKNTTVLQNSQLVCPLPVGILKPIKFEWIICFRNLLSHNRIIATNTLPRVNNGKLYFISLATIRFWGGFWGRRTQWRSCIKDLFNKGNSADWQLIYFSWTLTENYIYFQAYLQHRSNTRYVFKTLYCETHNTMNQ